MSRETSWPHAPRRRVLWLLDIDGTISPYDTAGCDQALFPNLVWGPQAIPYRTAIVERVATMHASGLVDLAWLTTWMPEEASTWSKVGLQPESHYSREDAVQGPYRWWKANVVNALLADGRRLVWTDDDIARCGQAPLLQHPRLLAISPHPRSGLTEEHLDRIAECVLP